MSVAFIVGTGRCGTTLLSQMLNVNREICVPDELQILFEYSYNGKRLYDLFLNNDTCFNSPAELSAVISKICPHYIESYFDLSAYLHGLDYPVKDLRIFVAGLYAEISRRFNKRLFIEQTPWYGQRLDIVNQLFPEAKYIHVVRDGRDVAISFARTPWWYETIEKNLVNWNLEVNKIIYDAEILLKNDQYLQIRYEDLVLNTKKILADICNFLGVEYESDMLDSRKYVNYDSYSKFDLHNTSSSAYNKWKESLSSSVFMDSLYAWKKYKNYDFTNIPDYIAETLCALGYGD
jgi:hypothetical protein